MNSTIELWKPLVLTGIGVAKLEMPETLEKWRPIDRGVYETRRQRQRNRMMSDTISVQGNATALRVGRGVASDISVESARAKVLIPRIRLSQMKPHQRTTASLRWGLFSGFKDESTVLGMPVVVTLGDLRSL